MIESQGGFGSIDAAPPPPLPAGPWLEHRLFEAPWPLAIAFIAAALVMAAWGRAAAKPRVAFIGAWTCVTAATLIILAASWIETRSEASRRCVTEFVSAATHARADEVSTMLTPDAVLVLGSGARREPTDSIVRRVRTQCSPGGVYAVKECRVVEVQSLADEKSARVQIKLSVTPMGSGYPVVSWWRFDLEPDADRVWRVSGIELLSTAGGVTIN
jgi:hypothetical protein